MLQMRLQKEKKRGGIEQEGNPYKLPSMDSCSQNVWEAEWDKAMNADEQFLSCSCSYLLEQREASSAGPGPLAILRQWSPVFRKFSFLLLFSPFPSLAKGLEVYWLWAGNHTLSCWIIMSRLRRKWVAIITTNKLSSCCWFHTSVLP